jgi:hypothetical protein
MCAYMRINKEREQSEDIDVDGNIIIEWILGK